MNKSFDVQTFLKNFLSKEESSGFLLLIFAAFALLIVNSPLQSLYYDLKYLPLSIDIGEFFFLENLINDFRLLPVPEIKTEHFIFLRPVD